MGKQEAKIALMASIIVLITTFQTASAATIDFYGIEVNVQDIIQTKLTITFDSKIENFKLSLGKLAESAKITGVSANKGFAECDMQVADFGKGFAACNINGAPEGRNTVSIHLESLAAIEILGDKNNLITSYEFPFDTKDLSISYKLPERATLSEDPPQNSISPRNGDIKTDGKKIFVSWNKHNMTAGEIATFSASFTLPGQNSSPLNTLLILPIIIILAAFLWFAIKTRHKTKEAGESAAVSVLSKDEKALFDILKINEGKANQKVLVRESGFSKAKVSRILKEMKNRGMIMIEPISGRENRVVLALGQEKKKENSQPAAESQSEATKANGSPDNQNAPG